MNEPVDEKTDESYRRLVKSLKKLSSSIDRLLLDRLLTITESDPKEEAARLELIETIQENLKNDV